MNHVLRIIITIALPLVLAGCSLSFGLNQAAPTSTGEFLKGSVAKGFPVVPSYPRARIGESYGDNRMWGVYYVTGDKVDKVVSFYSQNLGKAGWESQLNQSGNAYVFTIRNAKYQGSIIVNTAADLKSTAITISINTRAPA